MDEELKQPVEEVEECRDIMEYGIVDRILSRIMLPVIDTEAKINEFLGIQ